LVPLVFILQGLDEKSKNFLVTPNIYDDVPKVTKRVDEEQKTQNKVQNLISNDSKVLDEDYPEDFEMDSGRKPR
jgi:hypothetical protein